MLKSLTWTKSVILHKSNNNSILTREFEKQINLKTKYLFVLPNQTIKTICWATIFLYDKPLFVKIHTLSSFLPRKPRFKLLSLYLQHQRDCAQASISRWFFPGEQSPIDSDSTL